MQKDVEIKAVITETKAYPVCVAINNNVALIDNVFFVNADADLEAGIVDYNVINKFF